jgi:hypothetical protein
LIVVVVAAVVLGVILSQSGGNNDRAPPAPAPTPAPTSANVEKLNEFLSGLPGYSIVLAQTDTNSPQGKAMAWLKNDSKFNEYELYRLYQRYALPVLFYSTNGDSWHNSTGWLSNANECEWYQFDDAGPADNDKCLEESRLSVLDMDSNGLVGTIPTELALLTDLLELAFNDTTVSGIISSELCVSCNALNPVASILA